MSLSKIIFFFVLVSLYVTVENSDKIIPYNYPLFLQCDPAWGNDMIYTETLCEVGCLETSISMALNGKGITIQPNNQTVNPAVLNTYLLDHHGYTQENDLREQVVTLINRTRIYYVGPFIPETKLNQTQITDMVKSQVYVVIANVLQGTHFVLVTGYDEKDENKFYVNDPYFNTDYYEYDTIVGWRVYTMK
eukprot:TRINITY_DN3361_c0_g1_i1.p1 TRINITY_DN3361_c0_g1~~TRINITY_DN3361_c0_g1_i1.p1  ORF type:complete len:199 (+),score=49.19 TRINITY_DN3361_c0_g1_i1:25-597(+)